MKFPFLASFIIFILVLARRIKWSNKQEAKQEKNFWETESAANSVRRKSLDTLDYIQIPMEKLPTNTLTEDPAVQDYLNTLDTLSKEKIVNLTGYTNTDLKLKYGTSNISQLSTYDQNYTLLASTLQSWADLLWEKGYRTESVSVMEFALSTHTDTSHTYYKLAEYYAFLDDHEKLESLLHMAETLPSANRGVIVRTLQESYL